MNKELEKTIDNIFLEDNLILHKKTLELIHELASKLEKSFNNNNVSVVLTKLKSSDRLPLGLSNEEYVNVYSFDIHHGSLIINIFYCELGFDIVTGKKYVIINHDLLNGTKFHNFVYVEEILIKTFNKQENIKKIRQVIRDII